MGEKERDELDPWMVLFLLLCQVELLDLSLVAEAVLVLLDLHLEAQEGPYRHLRVVQEDLLMVVQEDLLMVVQVDLLELVWEAQVDPYHHLWVVQEAQVLQS